MKCRTLTYDQFLLLDEKRQLFIDTLYKGLPYPTGSLKKVKQLHFHLAIVTEQDGAIVAQAVLYKNPEIRYQNEDTLLIGNYEMTDDPEVYALTWKTILDTARAEAKWLIGPMNGSTWASYRFGLSDLPLFFTETMHRGAYPEHFLRQGFSVLANYASYLDSDLNYTEDEIHSLKERTDANHLEIRPIDLNNFEEELRGIYELSITGFKNNFLYSSISFPDFYALYEPVRDLIDPRFCLLTLDDRKVVAVFFALKDLYDPSGETLIAKTIARLPERKYAATVRLMSHLVVKAAAGNGYRKMIHAFMHVENASVNVSRHFSGKPFKTYELFLRQL